MLWTGACSTLRGGAVRPARDLAGSRGGVAQVGPGRGFLTARGLTGNTLANRVPASSRYAHPDRVDASRHVRRRSSALGSGALPSRLRAGT